MSFCIHSFIKDGLRLVKIKEGQIRCVKNIYYYAKLSPSLRDKLATSENGQSGSE